MPPRATLSSAVKEAFKPAAHPLVELSKAAILKPMTAWTPTSWRTRTALQQPHYPDMAALAAVEAQLAALPPLVFAGEVERLKNQLADVAQGRAFLLQGGDCAESFAEFNANSITDSCRVLLQMAIVLVFGATIPVVKVARLAGQFAKPRSDDYETIGGQTLPSYRGDMVNGIDFNVSSRTPDPKRLLAGYHQSAITLNLVRGLMQGGFADLQQVQRWNSDFVAGSAANARYADLASRLSQTLDFMAAMGLTAQTVPTLRETDIYTSHEALLLPYEQALTRESGGQYYNLSAHMLWIGDRTRQLDSAHIEYCRGLANPLGLKCGPSLKPDDLLALIKLLNPKNEPGKLTLISRMGANIVAEKLPPLLAATQKAKAAVIWTCDPMHGNTAKTQSGLKTRDFQNILSEVQGFFSACAAMGVPAGGVHLELTGKHVTECIGGTQGIAEINLTEQYDTHCDPRLNGHQALELAFQLASSIQALKQANA